MLGQHKRGRSRRTYDDPLHAGQGGQTLFHSGDSSIFAEKMDIGAGINRKINFQPFLFTPRLQTFVAVQYSFPMPGLEGLPMDGWFTPRLEWAYQSSVELIGPEVPEGTQHGYNLLNARFSYDFFDDRAQVALWAKNLLNEDYFTFVTPTVSTLGFLTRTYAEPRTFGAELSWRF